MPTDPKKTPPSSRRKPNPKPRSKRKAARQGMDGATKTLVSIIAGLGAVAVVIFAGVGAYSYFDQPQKTTRTRVALPNAPPANTGESSREPNDLIAAFNAAEGPRSSFVPERAYEPGEVLIAAPPAGFEDKIHPAGFQVLEYINLGRLNLMVVRVSTPPGMSVPKALKKLAALLPGVTLDANSQFEASATNTARPGSNPRAMAGWDSLSATCGTGLVLGQIDSGVDITHPAFKRNNVTYKAFTKSGRKPGPATHGTAVAAMLVGTAEWGGLLPGAKLYAANMFEINAKGKKVGSSIGLMKAIDWLAGKKVNAVNLSIAGSDNKVVRKAFNLAKQANLLMIAAVGNWGRADKPAYPAAYTHVIAVTATKGTELIYSYANQGKYVDFAAPGVAIYTATPGGGGKSRSGTSFATPYITAMAAILAKARPTTTANDIRRALGKATRDLGKPGKDTIFGYGYVKARPICK